MTKPGTALGEWCHVHNVRQVRRSPGFLFYTSIAIAIIASVPLVYLLIRSIGSGPETIQLILRPRVFQVFTRTFLLVSTVSIAATVLGVSLAWLTVRTNLPVRRMWVLLTPLPLVIPSYVFSFLVTVFLSPKGMLQTALYPVFGIERLPDIHGFFGAWLTLTLLCYPYVLLPVRAALIKLDPALEDSAQSLGHSPWSTFYKVTLPILAPSIGVGALLTALYTLSDFGAVSIFGYETFTWAIYIQYESSFDRTAAAGLSMILIFFALFLVLAETRIDKSKNQKPGKVTSSRPIHFIPLGSWRPFATLYTASVIFVSLVVPLSVLSYWVVRGLEAGEPLLNLWEPSINSLSVSLAAAAATLLAALPIGILATRFPTKSSIIIEKVSSLGFALPGIVVSLGLVFFGIRVFPAIYQTPLLLIIGYMILFLQPAIGATRTSLQQVNSTLEESGRSLGRSPVDVFVSITLPLMRPGLLSGAAMVFLLTMKELPATLILSPIGFSTLATLTWSAASEAYFAQAAMPALLLILTSSIPLGMMIPRRSQTVSS